MEKQIKAFFYDYKYYLFPEDCPSLEELKKRSSVTATRLKEELCMAPDFIYESMSEETVQIENPERLFEITGTLRSHEEYDAVLRRQVDRVCPGCERYIEDGKPELNGHHREISLDGACYERRGEDETWDFATCVNVFWYRISLQLDALGSCIDKGNQKKINDIINKELSKFFLPVKLYGGVDEGRYCLLFAPDYNHTHIFRKILCYLAEAASREVSEIKRAGWEVLPYRKKGVFRYGGKHDFSKIKARIAETENGIGIGVEFYCKKQLSDKKTEALFQDFFDYLAESLGENYAQGLVTECSVSSDEKGMMPVCSLLPVLEEKNAENGREDKGYPAPLCFGDVRTEESGDCLPFRDKITEGVTNCPEMTFLTRGEIETAWWMDAVQFFYLYVPHSMDDGTAVSWYLANGDLVPEPLRDPEDGRVVGGGLGVSFCGEEAFIIDCFVASEQAFYRNMRVIAPVLSCLGAKLVTVKREGVAVYSCGYEFTLIENV